eukprot:CAMPEP_0117778632 /NCGR_PEP_ID=MMETSP0948-20121206/1112_1 /TAXON_ID=44440 /ORGANISM="Chattonella subsalsa, Strain CCMP2191" /LENGTH=162 /DNA_ID=CAMNT_0005606001 /DNA_START=445 /DNA_END=933 /DNA_ORIENTATION=-
MVLRVFLASSISWATLPFTAIGEGSAELQSNDLVLQSIDSTELLRPLLVDLGLSKEERLNPLLLVLRLCLGFSSSAALRKPLLMPLAPFFFLSTEVPREPLVLVPAPSLGLSNEDLRKPLLLALGLSKEDRRISFGSEMGCAAKPDSLNTKSSGLKSSFTFC